MDVFAALADPTRRRIVELVAARERSAGEIAGEFQFSRPAVSRHLRVLREAGLLASRGAAQRRMYRLEPTALAELDTWIDRTRAFWSTHLDDLQHHLEDKP
jgi:DNA-binding transcriptional ArsR family regulator